MKIKKIIKKSNAHRTLLMQRYRPEDLHQVRVGLRRLKSLLKQSNVEQSTHLQQQLSELIRNTNDARDWDTLLMSGEKYLSRDDFASVRPVLKNHSNQFRQRVHEVLDKSVWTDVINNSQRLLKSIEQTANNKQTLLPDDYAVKLLKKYILAYQRNDAESWHGLRNSVKSLRYQLEYYQSENKVSSQSITFDEHIKSTLDFCRLLQNFLGDWHDSVVHELLIEQLTDQKIPLTIESNAIFSHWKLLLGLSGYSNINRVKLLFIKNRVLFRQDVKV